MKKILSLLLVVAVLISLSAGLALAGDKQYRTLVIKEFSLEAAQIQEKPEAERVRRTV